MELRELLRQEHLELSAAAVKYAAGEISPSDFKHTGAPLGIYEQSNGLFMVRVRVPGGEITSGKLKALKTICDDNAVDYVHLTTRQDIQLQDVPLTNLFDIIDQCTDNGMPFRGGGGNTFRNLSACSHSGVHETSVFDVMPYVNALNAFALTVDAAFQLPRKLKIGFSCCRQDASYAICQDLGFIAVCRDGQKGFTVYGGGGMGRESSLAIKLINFLPAEDFLTCALAIIKLFYDHGNGENRNKARLRYVLKTLGDDAFKSLFQEYYAAAEHVPFQLAESLVNTVGVPAQEYTIESAHDEMIPWRELAVADTSLGHDKTMVRLFVPYGNMSCDDLGMLADCADAIGCPIVRLMQSQDILLPVVEGAVLPQLYSLISGLSTDVTGRSLKGLLMTCIGSTVCKVGILDAPSIGTEIAAELDKVIPKNPVDRAQTMHRILDDLRISGCPNTCGAHLVGAIGLQGMKKKIDGVSTEVCKIFTGGCINGESSKLATCDDDRIYPRTGLPTLIAENLLNGWKL